MILPTKYVQERASLLGQAAHLLSMRRQEMTVSELWTEAREAEDFSMSYDTFVLALDFLYIVGAVKLRDGVLLWGVE